MEIPQLRILLVEDNPAEVEFLQELLCEVEETNFSLTCVNRLGTALEHLQVGEWEIILLDLHLPDSQGLETFLKLKSQVPKAPILILSVLDDQTKALEAVRQGAQDYLLKGKLDGEMLVRAIRYAFERQQIAETLRQQAEREKFLAAISDKIRHSLELKDILQTTVTEVRKFLQVDQVTIGNNSSQSSWVVVVESLCHQASEEVCLWNPEVSAALDILGCIYSNEKSMPIELRKPKYLHLSNLLTQGILAAPIWLDEKLNFNHHQPHNHHQKQAVTNTKMWGILLVHHESNYRRWQPWEMDFLQSIAKQLSLAIQQSELLHQLEIANRELNRIANCDRLTGIANRRQFDQFLSREWRRLTREKQPLALIICDVDFFKVYNDTYGHLSGDACLKQVAQAINAAIKRPSDLVVRYGGEEFAVILPGTDLNGAMIVAQEIRIQVKQLKLLHINSPVHRYVTVSLGVSSTVPDQYQSLQNLIQDADQALYRAKKQGRDQACRGNSAVLQK